jgi:hypothetical protein
MTLVPFQPPPGIFSDDTTFSAEGRWADANGFRFYEGKAETIERHIALASSTTVSGTKMLAYKVSGAINIALAGTALKRYAISGASLTTITPASGWTGTQFSLQMWGDELLASPSGGKLFTSVAGAQATEITNAPDRITCMIVTNERQVLALGTDEEVGAAFNGRCIRGSDTEDYTDWTTTASNNAFEHILPGQANIVSGTVFGAYVLVWTEDALWIGQFIGDPAQTYRFDKVEGGVGLLGLDAFAILHGVVYWVSPAFTFHAYALGGLVQPIPCPILKDFQGNAERASPNTTFACALTHRDEVWFGYCDARDGTGAPTRYLIYCTSESANGPVWARGTWASLLPSQTTAGAMIDTPLSVGTSAAGPVVLPYSGSGALVMYARFGTDGPESAYIQSADWYLSESQRRMMIRSFVPDFEYQGGTVTLAISARDRAQSTASTSTYSITTAATKKDFRKSGKIATAKFTPAVSTRLRLGKPLFDVVTLGER